MNLSEYIENPEAISNIRLENDILYMCLQYPELQNKILNVNDDIFYSDFNRLLLQTFRMIKVNVSNLDFSLLGNYLLQQKILRERLDRACGGDSMAEISKRFLNVNAVFPEQYDSHMQLLHEVYNKRKLYINCLNTISDIENTDKTFNKIKSEITTDLRLLGKTKESEIFTLTGQQESIFTRIVQRSKGDYPTVKTGYTEI